MSEIKKFALPHLLLLWLLTVQLAVAQFPADGAVINMDIPLRLRAAPNTESGVLDLLDSGTGLRVIGRTADSLWLSVETERYSSGWVFAEYVDLNRDMDTFPVITDVGPMMDFRGTVIGITPNARAIFEQGQRLGNRADVFSKVGDSITVAPHMLSPLSLGVENLGDYAYLQATIEYFSQTPAHNSASSFANISLAAHTGWSAPAVLDPRLADSETCLAGESPLLCEYRVVQPSIALIMFGTNDVGFSTPVVYRYSLERITELSISRGVIPVLSTIPPRRDFAEEVAVYNQVVRETAIKYDVPLWDYGRVMAAVGDISLDTDGVHPSSPPRGIEGSVDFRRSNLYYGYVLRNLTALHVLDALLHQVIEPTSIPSNN